MESRVAPSRSRLARRARSTVPGWYRRGWPIMPSGTGTPNESRTVGATSVRVGPNAEGAGGVVDQDVGGLDGTRLDGAHAVHHRDRRGTGRQRLTTVDGADVGVADRRRASSGLLHRLAQRSWEARQVLALV